MSRSKQRRGLHPASPVFLLALALLETTSADAAPLRWAEVAFPAINCAFDADCVWPIVQDEAAPVPLPLATDGGFLQSRTFAPGESGTTGAGLYPYLYRLDLRAARGTTAAICVTGVELDFGPLTPLDYDGDGRPDDLFVATGGGLGSVGIAAADESAGLIRLQFASPVCPGQSSYFVGLASASPPDSVVAKLPLTAGLEDLTVPALAPTRAASPPPWQPCEIEPGGPTLPIPADFPVCRCVQDAGLREFRCALLHPDFLLVRRVPWPLPEGPFGVTWTLRPLSRLAGPVRVTNVLPANLDVDREWLGGASFSIDLSSGEATIELPAQARSDRRGFPTRLSYGGESFVLRLSPPP